VREAKEAYTCIVEEEFPEEFLHLDPKDATLPGDFKISSATEEVEELRTEEKFGTTKDKEGAQRLQARQSVVWRWRVARS
jgi:hypothetical protein